MHTDSELAKLNKLIVYSDKGDKKASSSEKNYLRILIAIKGAVKGTTIKMYLDIALLNM